MNSPTTLLIDVLFLCLYVRVRSLCVQPTSTMPRRLAPSATEALQNDVAAVSVATMDKLAKRLRSRALSHRAGKRKGRPSAAPSSLASVLSVDVRSLAIDAASAATPPGSSGGGGATSTNMVPSASQLSPQRAGPSDGLTVTQFEATPSKVTALMRSVMASPPRPQQPAQVVPVENPTTPPRPGSTAGASATDAHVLAHLPLPVRRVLDQLQDAYDRYPRSFARAVAQSRVNLTAITVSELQVPVRPKRCDHLVRHASHSHRG